jgi:hypothetical protein
VSYTAEVYEPANSNRNAAYSQQKVIVSLADSLVRCVMRRRHMIW